MEFDLLAWLEWLCGTDMAHAIIVYLSIDERLRLRIRPLPLVPVIALSPWRYTCRSVQCIASYIRGEVVWCRSNGYEIAFPNYRYRVEVSEATYHRDLTAHGCTDWRYRNLNGRFDYHWTVMIYREGQDRWAGVEIDYWEYDIYENPVLCAMYGKRPHHVWVPREGRTGNRREYLFYLENNPFMHWFHWENLRIT